jgi:hypothetical protein
VVLVCVAAVRSTLNSRRVDAYLAYLSWNAGLSQPAACRKSALSTSAMLSVCKRLRNSSTSSGSHDLPLPLVSFSGMYRQRDVSGATDYGVAKFPIDLYSRGMARGNRRIFNSAWNHLLLSAFRARSGEILWLAPK